MENNILIQVNKYIKRLRPYISEEIICDTFRNNSFLELAFMSKRCPNDAYGSCIMCDYGATRTEKIASIYLAEMNKILNKEKGIQFLLLCTNGSILNPNQISETTLHKILETVNETDIPNIIIEAHYNDISIQKLDALKQLLPNKVITLELGLETISQHYQDTLIMKHIDIVKFGQTVSLIQSYGFHVDINILLGLPFLSTKEQFDEALKTVSWALAHECNPVIFPVNIKPYTLLMHMYKNHFYFPISHWLFILLLDAIETKHLSRITIAYYGNREDDYYADEQTIFPNCCSVCNNTIQEFYAEFCKEDDSYKRKKILQNILAFNQCNCLKEQKNKLKHLDEDNFQKKYALYVQFLHKEFDDLL